MNRRGALVVLAFLAAGVLLGAFATTYIHSSPSAITAQASSDNNGGSPIVDINLTTVAQVGSGDHPNWVGYLPTTFFKVPPNSTVRMTINQQDGASGLRNPYYSLVRGTVGDSMTVNGKTMQTIDPTTAAHSPFAVPGWESTFPPPWRRSDNAPAGATNIVVFSFKVPSSGIFHWQCFVPCARGHAVRQWRTDADARLHGRPDRGGVMSATRRLVYTLGAIWLVLAVIGSFVIAILPFPPGAASNVAGSVTDTIRLLTWAAWPVFSLTIIGVIGAVLVRRRDPDAAAAPARELRGNPRLASTWIGVVGAVVLALAIVGTITLGNDDAAQALGLGGRTISGDNGNVIGGALDEGGYLPVQVIAQQWQFTYRYPGYGGFESAHLVLPVNANVQFHITSLDVTHSFWYPALGVKADAVPLHDNTFNVHVLTIGNYRIQCGELCGLWHGGMDDNNAAVVSPSDFGTWVAQQQAADAPIMQYLPPYSHTYVPDPPAYGT